MMAPSNLNSVGQRIRAQWKIGLLIAAAFLLGLLLGGDGEKTPASPEAPPGAAVEWYTCSMHPSVRLQDPNARCPICGMELIPIRGGSGEGGPPRQLVMSEAAKALAEVETSPVERSFVTKEVRLVGKVDYDETSMRTITAWVAGRLDRLFVDYTGVAVQKGAPLVYMYSPGLLEAQEALLAADRAHEAMKGTAASEANIARQRGTILALEERLKNWGLLPEQIVEIREHGAATDHMEIRSPIAGIVTAKRAVEGDYVSIGTKIYEIADLSRVWVYLDVYESDLAWVKYAQEVAFEAEAYPGETFRGRVSFIDPFLHEMTRTVRVRVSVDNSDGRLKPGMFVRARIHARLAEGGRIVEPFLADKWISPVHPEVMREEAGLCPICGTPLVSAESLGYVGEESRPPLVVPATAPLRTGTRAVVYVEVPGADRPTYEGREITLGTATQHHYLVLDGLREGERVVTKGNFKIDSALQILARPSMMSPPAEGVRGPAVPLEVSFEFVSGLTPLYRAALDAARFLAADDLENARAAMAATMQAADAIDMRRVTGAAHMAWMDSRGKIRGAARTGTAAQDIAAIRGAFQALSDQMLSLVERFGQSTEGELYEAHCPMAAEGAGASWLAAEKQIANPYFGASMLRCGDIRQSFASLSRPVLPAAFRKGVTDALSRYLEVGEALAKDDGASASAAAASLLAALAATPAGGLTGEANAAWRAEVASARLAADALSKAAEIEAARRSFALLSEVFARLLRRFGHGGPGEVALAHCPMAFANRGADWIQRGEEIRNPYFGAAMPRCGDIRERFAAQAGD